MKTAPDVSVIVPCYRAGPYLARFVASLQAQSYAGAWEAVFVDDGDPAGADVYACVDDPRCRVVHQPNRGVSAARNRGLAETTGEIVLFADPDDELGPDWMRHLAEGIAGVDLAWGGYRTILDGRTEDHVPADAGEVYLGADVRTRAWRAVFGYRLRDVLRWQTPGRLWRGCRRELGSACWRAFRRSVLGELRFDETLALYEDAIFVAEYAARARSLRVLSAVDYRYTIRPTGAMTAEHRLRLAEHKFALREARKRLDPSMSSWRGSHLLSALELLAAGELRQALRYFLFR